MTAETGPEQEAAPDRTDESVDRDSPETESLESLRTERDEALAARQRAMADFSNFQRRSAENEARARVQGMAEVVRNLVPALDQFEMALGQSTAGGDADGLVEGLRLVKDGFLQALERNGVRQIDPEVGAEFDPTRHEAMMRQGAEGVAPGHVSMVAQTGWELDGIIIRPAKVAVAPSDEEPGAGEGS